MKILHVVPCADEANGVYHVARMLAKKQSADGNEASVVTLQVFNSSTNCPDEVWIHGMWLPREWRACLKVLRNRSAIGVPRLVRMTHGSLSPIYLERQGKWKKRLVAPIERWLFSKTDRVVVTGEWEAEWCRQWGLKNEMQILDLKSFFNLGVGARCRCGKKGEPLHVLYLGRRHPLKGVLYLEWAVAGVNIASPLVDLRIESNIYGDEKEKVWEWADVLCLPTLSENFGLVVAEALEHGKPVITTDGAPAWYNLKPTQGVYLRGYREGSDAERVKLLKDALIEFLG